MFRLVGILLLAVTCNQVVQGQGQGQGQSHLLDYLSNFNIPGFGNTFTNILDNLRRSLPGPNLDGQATQTKTGNFSFTQWSTFGGCTKDCGGGSRARSRSCLNETGHVVTLDNCFTSLRWETYDLYKILALRNEITEVDEELCNKHDCRVSVWELDESCSRKCGGGFMTYSRTCYDSSDQSKCNFQSTRLVSCNTEPCFRVGEWQEWSRCTALCGAGRASRKRDCEPNAESYSPLYQELKYALDHVTQPEVLRTVENENEIFYFSQYVSSCASNIVQTRFCNIKPCPDCPMNQIYHTCKPCTREYCPMNQIYHTCKPCTRQCRKIHIIDLTDIKLEFPKIQLNLNGCGGVCVPGCGCHPRQPLLSKNGGCYEMNLRCPENQMSQSQSSYLILQLLSKRTTVKPALPSSPTLQRALSRASLTTTTIRRTPAVTTMPTTSKPWCPKDMPIMDSNFCECAGDFKRMTCLSRDNAKCPFKCTNKQTCPSPLSPRLKSTDECRNSECEADYQCTEGYLCCELLCGRRCIEIL